MRALALIALLLVASPVAADELAVTLSDAQQSDAIALPTVVQQCVNAAIFGGDISVCRAVQVSLTGIAAAVQQAKAKQAAAKPADAPEKK